MGALFFYGAFDMELLAIVIGSVRFYSRGFGRLMSVNG